METSSLKELLTTAAVVGGVYFGIVGAISLYYGNREPTMDETVEKADAVAKSAEELENFDGYETTDSSKVTSLPWDEMRIPHAGMVAHNMTERERSNTQLLQLFGGVPPVSVSDMTSLITGGRL